jgi:hypothetical protein
MIRVQVFGVLLTWCLLILTPGCSLIPKRVEFGQKKVKPVPEQTVAEKEVVKQAAALAERRAAATEKAALIEGSSEKVRQPAHDTSVLTRSVSLSLGPPENQWQASVDELAARVDRLTARLDRKIDEYREKTEPLVGKKIEGTGWLQVPYFLWIGILAGLAFLVWTALKIFGAIYPPVGLGISAMGTVGRLSSRAVSQAFGQVVAGGEKFKEALDKSGLEAVAVAKVKELFQISQEREQDAQVQRVIRQLTQK